MVPWWECPHISPDVVEEYKRTYGEQMYLREFCCEFADSESSAFRVEDIEGMASDDVDWEDALPPM